MASTNVLLNNIQMDIGGNNEWPDDAKLYQPYEVEQILMPDMANCLSVHAFLQMLKLKYETVYRTNAAEMSPTGRVPFVKVGQFLIAELEPLVTFVQSKNISLTKNLTEMERSDMRAYMSLINTVLGNAENYMTWCDSETYEKVTKKRFGSIYPFPLNYILLWKKRSATIERLKALGGKTDQDAVLDDVELCCQSVSDRLGDKEYFFNSGPTELDCLLFAHIYTLVNWPNLIFGKLVCNLIFKYPKLVCHCIRFNNLIDSQKNDLWIFYESLLCMFKNLSSTQKREKQEALEFDFNKIDRKNCSETMESQNYLSNAMQIPIFNFMLSNGALSDFKLSASNNSAVRFHSVASPTENDTYQGKISKTSDIFGTDITPSPYRLNDNENQLGESGSVAKSKKAKYLSAEKNNNSCNFLEGKYVDSRENVVCNEKAKKAHTVSDSTLQENVLKSKLPLSNPNLKRNIHSNFLSLSCKNIKEPRNSHQSSTDSGLDTNAMFNKTCSKGKPSNDINKDKYSESSDDFFSSETNTNSFLSMNLTCSQVLNISENNPTGAQVFANKVCRKTQGSKKDFKSELGTQSGNTSHSFLNDSIDELSSDLSKPNKLIDEKGAQGSNKILKQKDLMFSEPYQEIRSCFSNVLSKRSSTSHESNTHDSIWSCKSMTRSQDDKSIKLLKEVGSNFVGHSDEIHSSEIINTERNNSNSLSCFKLLNKSLKPKSTSSQAIDQSSSEFSEINSLLNQKKIESNDLEKSSRSSQRSIKSPNLNLFPRSTDFSTISKMVKDPVLTQNISGEKTSSLNQLKNREKNSYLKSEKNSSRIVNKSSSQTDVAKDLSAISECRKEINSCISTNKTYSSKKVSIATPSNEEFQNEMWNLEKQPANIISKKNPCFAKKNCKKTLIPVWINDKKSTESDELLSKAEVNLIDKNSCSVSSSKKLILQNNSSTSRNSKIDFPPSKSSIRGKKSLSAFHNAQKTVASKFNLPRRRKIAQEEYGRLVSRGTTENIKYLQLNSCGNISVRKKLENECKIATKTRIFSSTKTNVKLNPKGSAITENKRKIPESAQDQILKNKSGSDSVLRNINNNDVLNDEESSQLGSFRKILPNQALTKSFASTSVLHNSIPKMLKTSPNSLAPEIECKNLVESKSTMSIKSDSSKNGHQPKIFSGSLSNIDSQSEILSIDDNTSKLNSQDLKNSQSLNLSSKQYFTKASDTASLVHKTVNFQDDFENNSRKKFDGDQKSKGFDKFHFSSIFKKSSARGNNDKTCATTKVGKETLN